MHSSLTFPLGRSCGRPFAAALAAALAPIALGDTLMFISANEEDVGWFGAAVAGIPDLDGDGHDDVIVGARGEDGGGVVNAGRVYIHSGATGALIRAHSSPNDTFNGVYGWSVAGVADLNGDGRGDYVVGAPGENGDGVAASGRVYVYSGINGTLIRTHVSGNAAPGGAYGQSVAAIDDLNNDGRGDYIIGAPLETVGGFNTAGRAYVLSGTNGAILATKVSPNAEAAGRFGTSVSGVPDMNGDGRGDYVVGAPNEDPGASPVDSGRAYLFSGVNHALVHTFVSGDPEVDGHFGTSVAGVADVGGFGGGDVIVGAPGETVDLGGGGTFDDAGQVHIFSGAGGFLAHTLHEPAANIAADGLFGQAVAGLDDVDGDGLGDVIVGAPSWPGYRAYVFAGDSEALLETLSTPDGLGSNQYWGGAVASAGDVNGDGLTDYLVGGRGSDDFPSGPSESGRVSLYRPLRNDTCGADNVIPELFVGANFFTTIGATEGAPEPGCVQFADPGPDAWFTHEATCTGPLTISTCAGATFDTKIAVYGDCAAACGFGDPLACNNNAPLGGGCAIGESQLEIAVTQGTCYRIRIGGAGDQSGTGIVTLTCQSCNAYDLDGDGTVNGADLGLLLAQWGGAGSSDFDGNGTVDGADLGLLLAAWGTGC